MTKKVNQLTLTPKVFDVSKKFGQLEEKDFFGKYSVLEQTETGVVQLIQLEDRIPLHKHPIENHFVYIYKGRVKGTIGDISSEFGPGQLISIPAGVPHQFQRIGDAPVEVIAFSTPIAGKDDTVNLENK